MQRQGTFYGSNPVTPSIDAHGLLIYPPFRHPADCEAISQDPFWQVALVWILRFGAAERSMTE
jgi:hypothetical protein